MTRVLLADDHVLLLSAFAKLLEPKYAVVGTAADGRALVAEARRLKPDLIVTDIAMPLLNGLDAARQIRLELPQVKVIFLTVSEDPDLAREALASGASGYLLKRSAAGDLFRALSAAREGRRYVTPEIAEALEATEQAGPGGRTSHATLTPRQREVLQLLAEGRSMKEAAAVLGVTPRTIAFHKYRLMDEFRLKSTADLVQFAIRERVLPAFLR
jgi:DNA-binding NarL/FixJ family response regulator